MLYQEIIIKLARRTSVNLFLHFFSQASGGKHVRDTQEEGAPPLTLPSHSPRACLRLPKNEKRILQATIKLMSYFILITCFKDKVSILEKLHVNNTWASRVKF